MKLRRLSGFLVIIAIGQPTLPVSAKSEGGVRQESRVGTFTTRELDRLVPTPRPEDVASPKALIVALHASISGPKGPFDWSRFRSLFLPTACLGEAGRKRGGQQHIMYQSVNDWIRSVRNLRPKVALKEIVYKARIEQFDNIATAFYSGHEESTVKGETNVREVSICQMLYDGKRWWIASNVWNVSLNRWDLPPDLEP
jgi:hypothetical protein